MKDKAVLEMKNIHKSFPGVRALQGVDFTLCAGEIHALMGENGAGKSTLIKVLTGVYEKDEGQIFLQGSEKAVAIHSPQDAQNLGISTVYQEITLCPNLSVAENMYIGRTKGFGQNWRKMNENADKILRSLDIPAKASQQLASCSIAIQQMVAIARAVDMQCKVLILDEPTSSLDEQEVAKLFGFMRDLKARGVGIIFVTHFLDQVYEVCDKITVLRDGKLVGEYEIKDLPRVQLVSKMLGKELDDLSDIKGSQQSYEDKAGSEPVFQAEGLQSDAGIKPFDFYIKKGEVNGFTGLLGSGRSECVRAIFGADRVIAGTVKRDGRTVKIAKPLDAMKQGIAYLPEDRKVDGIVGELSVRENIILALQVMKGFFRPFTRAEANKFAEEYIKILAIDAYIEIGVVVALLVVILLFCMLRWTKKGRCFYAVGGNRQSALMLGINVKRTIFMSHLICSVLAGIAGFVYFMHVGSGSASNAKGMEMNAIASSIIGGTMLTGGVGNIIGTLFGVLSLSAIQNIVSSAGLDEAWWKNITIAAMICLFLIIQSVVMARKKKILTK